MKLPLLVGSILFGLVAVPAISMAMNDADCEAAWTTADRDKDGSVTEAEAVRYYAALRVANKSVADKMSKADFLANCKAGVFDAAQTEAGAPLKGANSFTEGQAKDRVLAHGFTEVSTLVKDGDGIWRGTAKQGDKQVPVAVDFKGNVVTQQSQ